MTIRYGTSGNPPNFFKSEFGKNRINAVNWIRSINLNAYEYLMTYGARTREEVAKTVGEKSKEHDVEISVSVGDKVYGGYTIIGRWLS